MGRPEEYMTFDLSCPFPIVPIVAISVGRRLPNSPSRRVADSLSRGVVFQLRIPRIRSQNRNGSKGSLSDL